MSSKRQAMAAKKKTRQSKRSAEKKVKTQISKTQILRNAVENNQGRTIAQLADGLVKSGISTKEGKPPKNEDVLKMLGDISGQLIVLHAGLEIVETLLKEHSGRFTEEQLEIADKVDRAVIKISEDTNAIIAFIDQGRDMMDYLDLFLHLTDYVQEMATTSMYGLYEKVINVEKDNLREYLNEHMPQDMDSLNFSFPYHNKRVARISEKYATKVGESLMDIPAVQLFGEEGLESDDEIAQAGESLILETADAEGDHAMTSTYAAEIPPATIQ
jgi:uncharacterized radical SAM superfamily protein